jgi:hypothetical protein
MQSGHADAGEALPLNAKGRKSRASDLATTTYEFPYMRKPTNKSFGQLIYDRQQGKVFGRTPKNWGELSKRQQSTLSRVCLCSAFYSP